jgi:hypothetical protein
MNFTFRKIRKEGASPMLSYKAVDFLKQVVRERYSGASAGHPVTTYSCVITWSLGKDRAVDMSPSNFGTLRL